MKQSTISGPVRLIDFTAVRPSRLGNSSYLPALLPPDEVSVVCLTLRGHPQTLRSAAAMVVQQYHSKNEKESGRVFSIYKKNNHSSRALIYGT